MDSTIKLLAKICVLKIRPEKVDCSGHRVFASLVPGLDAFKEPCNMF